MANQAAATATAGDVLGRPRLCPRARPSMCLPFGEDGRPGRREREVGSANPQRRRDWYDWCEMTCCDERWKTAAAPNEGEGHIQFLVAILLPEEVAGGTQLPRLKLRSPLRLFPARCQARTDGWW